ncbi:hypothetical protein QAD02_011978 [Eretmocerus hayati]|uniref:Uncharacterized protein n=1 Tax=Eretmocerus hayati TaxID=131215 RepID=A0ACC2NYJ8_9HYME|nr:hypothetical protein QAD02_011978 [Eretmocerus hayati]
MELLNIFLFCLLLGYISSELTTTPQPQAGSSNGARRQENQDGISSPQRCSICRTCGASFSDPRILTQHIRRNHRGERPYCCHICDASFSWYSPYNTHMQSHNCEGEFPCRVCGKTFALKSSMNKHLQRHPVNGDFSCKFCPRRFGYESYLRLHMATHTSRRDFTCELCGRKFLDLPRLNLHRETHTGPRPFACEMCQRRFKQREDLDEHKERHFSDENLECSVCGKRFLLLARLKKHEVTHTAGSSSLDDVRNELSDCLDGLTRVEGSCFAAELLPTSRSGGNTPIEYNSQIEYSESSQEYEEDNLNIVLLDGDWSDQQTLMTLDPLCGPSYNDQELDTDEAHRCLINLIDQMDFTPVIPPTEITRNFEESGEAMRIAMEDRAPSPCNVGLQTAEEVDHIISSIIESYHNRDRQSNGIKDDWQSLK